MIKCYKECYISYKLIVLKSLFYKITRDDDRLNLNKYMLPTNYLKSLAIIIFIVIFSDGTNTKMSNPRF